VDVNTLYPIVYDLIDEEYAYTETRDYVPPSPTSVVHAPLSLVYGHVHHHSHDETGDCKNFFPSSPSRMVVDYSIEENDNGDDSVNSEYQIGDIIARVQSSNSLQQLQATRDAPPPSSVPIRRNRVGGDVRDPVCYCTPRHKSANTFDSMFVLTRQIDVGSSLSRSVWETIQRRTGLRYAVKIVDRQSLSKVENDAINKEVRLLKKLQCDNEIVDVDEVDGSDSTDSCTITHTPTHTHAQHNNVLQLVDFFEEPSQFYIVTEYAQTNLLDYLLDEDNKASLDEEHLKSLMKSILHGVQSIHAQNICHRDLKLENILLENSSDITSVRIADFGLAAELPTPITPKSTKQKQQEGLTEKCGSLSYVAPEILQGERPYDTQVDMWSLGIIMYSIVTGVFPFVGRSREDLFRKIVKGEYAFLRKDWLPLSYEAKKFCSSLLRVNPRKRMTIEDALRHPWICPPSAPTPTVEIPQQEQQRQQLHVQLQQPMLEKEHFELVQFDKHHSNLSLHPPLHPQYQKNTNGGNSNTRVGGKKHKKRLRRVFLKAIGRSGRKQRNLGGTSHRYKNSVNGSIDDDQTMSVASSSDLQPIYEANTSSNKNNTDTPDRGDRPMLGSAFSI